MLPTIKAAGLLLALLVVGSSLSAQAALAANAQAQATDSGSLASRRACLFDPTGQNGPLAKLFQPYLRKARDWGYDIQTQVYTDESVAAGDFRAGRCDMAILTGLRTIRFVRFAGSLDMIGGLSNYREEHQAIQAMSSPKAAADMRTQGFEVVGVTPLGRSYLLARHRADLADLDHLAGKRVAVLNYDRQASTLADKAGLSPVPASTTSFGPMFTSGSVDIAYAPALAFGPLELYQGLKPDGGIARFPLGLLSNQIIIHTDRFDDGFGQTSRAWVLDHLFEPAAKSAREAEHAVPDHFWVPIDKTQQQDYRELFRSVRQTLWNDGWYDHRMQRLLKKIRCSHTPGAAECTLASEGGPVS